MFLENKPVLVSLHLGHSLVVFLPGFRFYTGGLVLYVFHTLRLPDFLFLEAFCWIKLASFTNLTISPIWEHLFLFRYPLGFKGVMPSSLCVNDLINFFLARSDVQPLQVLALGIGSLGGSLICSPQL